MPDAIAATPSLAWRRPVPNLVFGSGTILATGLPFQGQPSSHSCGKSSNVAAHKPESPGFARLTDAMAIRGAISVGIEWVAFDFTTQRQIGFHRLVAMAPSN
jgi:hypothetical protein